MSKAGPSLLRAMFFRAADTARRQDPQLARIYYVQMTERGGTHIKACCVVAGHLAERAWAVLNRGTPYVTCDNNGNPVTPPKHGRSSPSAGPSLKKYASERRSRKTAGKAPHAALTRPDKRGDPPRPRSSRSRGRQSTPPPKTPASQQPASNTASGPAGMPETARPAITKPRPDALTSKLP